MIRGQISLLPSKAETFLFEKEPEQSQKHKILYAYAIAPEIWMEAVSQRLVQC